MRKPERYKLILAWFEKNVPVAETELNYNNPFELLVAVILSAQCTDKRVNKITPELFDRFPNAVSLAEAPVGEVFEYIRSCSYPNNKAKHLVGMAHMLVNKFDNQIPTDVKTMQEMPGVGRKTANVIASVVYNQPTMAVDTHVFRVSERLGLTYRAKTPLESEKQLVKNIPEALIPMAHHWLILHGRYICTAIKPKCEKCGISAYCKYFEKQSK